MRSWPSAALTFDDTLDLDAGASRVYWYGDPVGMLIWSNRGVWAHDGKRFKPFKTKQDALDYFEIVSVRAAHRRKPIYA